VACGGSSANSFIADIIYFKFVIGSTILMALGVYLLWHDFTKHGPSP
jgi:hypothetical protein